jgi:AcrR family transcriptional regulator
MKDEILQRALRQFLKYGIRKMSVQKLIAPLGISTKTFYKYFRSKKELLEEVLHLYHAQKYQLLENLSTDQNIVALLFHIWYMAVEREYKVNRVFFQDLHHYYPELERKTNTLVARKFRKRFMKIIQKGIKEGVFKSDILPRVVLEGLLALYNIIPRAGKFKKLIVSPYEMLLNTVGIYIKGFCTTKGIQKLDEHIITLKPFREIKAAN